VAPADASVAPAAGRRRLPAARNRQEENPPRPRVDTGTRRESKPAGSRRAAQNSALDPSPG
jgi:hypothetical protein